MMMMMKQSFSLHKERLMVTTVAVRLLGLSDQYDAYTNTGR